MAPSDSTSASSPAGRWSRYLWRLSGVGLIGGGAIALAAPLAVGTWSLQFLALPMMAVGAVELYRTAMSRELRTHPGFYAPGVLAIAAALVLYVSPALVATGVVAVLLMFLAIDGIVKTGQAAAGRSAARRIPTAVNGVSSLLIAWVGWWLWRRVSLESAIGVAVGGCTIAAGWRLLASPLRDPEDVDSGEPPTNVHPYEKLGLGAHELFGTLNASRAESAPAVRERERYWLAVAGVVLFATHMGRMRTGDTWLGLISPFVATAGDFFMAVVLGGFLVLPVRLGWRRLSLPLERKAWQLRLSGEDARLHVLPRRLMAKWTEARMAFAGSLRDARARVASAAAVAVGLGLPLAALFAAMNPVWGFTWYFNTESWASAYYQKMTELRVDTWRAAMVDAIRSAHGGGGDDLFLVRPPGTEDGDFSFLVIGDPGEGDASQYALVDRYLDIGRREDVKFLVIASDVIYPAGAMEDYEKGFYVPFKGFTKPIYAIPGNHDWFDALEGFNANFLEPQSARAALAARVEADLRLTSTTRRRIDRLLTRGQRLRDLYGVQIALQRAPFFEMQTSDFALIAIDTGILRTVDERQLAWLKAALERARGKFTMAIPGHPRYAGGADTSAGDTGFAELHATLDRAGVDVVMAGDTHAFEYYADHVAGEGGPRAVHHFVNGGGGAYLSIGGALGWPDVPATKTWAFYPSPDAIRTKLDAETPRWKWPFWAWIRRFGGWPVSIETLSGVFDFNQAPFFQSFMEVRVERSKGRIIFALHGVTGPIRRRELHAPFGGATGGPPDAPFEVVVNMSSPPTPPR